MLRDNPTISERTSFSSTNVANTTGKLYSMGDPLSNSKYYKDVVRPVISITKCAKVKSGNGTPESPYEIDENSCSK